MSDTKNQKKTTANRKGLTVKRRYGLLTLGLGIALSAAGVSATHEAKSDAQASPNAATVYENVPPDQIEFISSEDRIVAVASSGSSSAIWEVLEHGEKVECMKCIPAVEPLLFDRNPETREIAAWWLRRRIFGVFGSGEVYQRTLEILKSDPDPERRAMAADAAGEFLAKPGIQACAAAIQNDQDARVRAAAAQALGRLNDDAGGALSQAIRDPDVKVRLVALTSAGKINAFADAETLVSRLSDPEADVRRRAIEVIEGRGIRDAAGAILGLASSDSDARVRAAACHAVGALGDSSARGELERLAEADADTFVRDQARIARRRL